LKKLIIYEHHNNQKFQLVILNSKIQNIIINNPKFQLVILNNKIQNIIIKILILISNKITNIVNKIINFIYNFNHNNYKVNNCNNLINKK